MTQTPPAKDAAAGDEPAATSLTMVDILTILTQIGAHIQVTMEETAGGSGSAPAAFPTPPAPGDISSKSPPAPPPVPASTSISVGGTSVATSVGPVPINLASTPGACSLAEAVQFTSIESNSDSSDSDYVDDDPTIQWYCVTRGHAVGVFSHWYNVAPLVVRVRTACYSCYASRALAHAAFARAHAVGAVRLLD